jgi:hypothetical protein
MSAAINNLYKIADELRGQHPFDALLILKTAKSRGVPFDLEDVNSLLTSDRKSNLFCCPHFIQKFIHDYLKDNPLNSILDTSAGIGALLAPIVHELAPNQAIALEENQQAHEIAIMLGHESGIDWPWWSSKPESLTFPLDDNDLEIRDDADKLIILKSSLLMTPDGVGFFITSPSFTFKHFKNGVYKNLSRFNLFIDAILSLPGGIFPGTSVGGLLVIIRKQKPEKLFVGELSSNVASNDIILKNLKARKQGKMPQLGALIDVNSFSSRKLTSLSQSRMKNPLICKMSFTCLK